MLKWMRAASLASSKSRGSWLTATFFGIGHLQPGSGTWAAAVTVLLWWAAARTLQPISILITGLIVSVAITLIGIPSSTVVARDSGQKDPGFVVIDEVAGQLIALLGVPLDWKYL